MIYEQVIRCTITELQEAIQCRIMGVFSVLESETFLYARTYTKNSQTKLNYYPIIAFRKQ